MVRVREDKRRCFYFWIKDKDGEGKSRQVSWNGPGNEGRLRRKYEISKCRSCERVQV